MGSRLALSGVEWAELVRDQLRHAKVDPAAVAAACRLAERLELDDLPAPSVMAGCCDAVHITVNRRGRADEGVMLSIRPGRLLAEPIVRGALQPGDAASGRGVLDLARAALDSCRFERDGGPR
jgi:hypothetical protein